VSFGKNPTFRRNTLPPSSGSESKSNKKTGEECGKLKAMLLGCLKRRVPPKRRAVSKLHGVATQKVV
jgi:hypothetical protein